jgi:HTH-type transcriptional regulator / antitoxin HigA
MRGLMTIKKIYPHEPDYAVPPGRILQRTIDALGMEQKELAIRTGLDKKTINQIIKGIHVLSQQTALKLERATGVPARMWNNLEMQYRERLARQQDRIQLEQELEWLKSIPTRELIRRKIIENTLDKVSLLRQVLAFFGVSNTAEWNSLWMDTISARFRRSRSFDLKPGLTATWMRLGELKAQKCECDDYDKDAFLRALRNIRTLTVKSPAVWQPEMIRLCSEAGVAVVFIPEIKGCTVSGLTRWLKSKAMIQLSLRYKSDDHFWFTFFHEAGHILYDPKKAIILEDGEGNEDSEKRANRFAENFLIPPEHQSEMRGMKSKASVERFARKLGIAPGIVAGQLQKRGIILYSHLNKLKRKLIWAD